MKSRVITTISIAIISVFLFACASENKANFEQGYLIFNGEKYIETDGIYVESNHKLCKVDEYTVYSIEGDENHNYVVVRSFLDNYLYVKEGFLSEESKIVGVSIGYNYDGNAYSDDEMLIKTITGILAKEQNLLEDDNTMEQCRKEGISVSVKYDNDVVGHIIGYLLTYNGQNMFYNYSKKTICAISDEEMKMLNKRIVT